MRALLDSGAPFTLFDRSTGDAVGVDFSRGAARRERFRVAGDDRIAQMEAVELVIPVGPFESFKWSVEVGFFLEDWGMPFAGLLGQDGFFDRWVVSFDYPRSFVIEARESFLERLPAPLTDDQLNDLWEWQELGWRGQPGQR